MNLDQELAYAECQIEELFARYHEMAQDFWDISVGRVIQTALVNGYLPALLRQIHDKKDPPKIYFVTINPDETKIKFQHFKALIEKLVSRAMFVNPLYAFEQRGKTIEEIGKGFHCHIISDKSSKLSPAQVRKNIYSSLKNYVGNIKHIDVRVYKGTFKQEKIDYIKGIKWDDEKDASVRLNPIWRGMQKIFPIYPYIVDGRRQDCSTDPEDTTGSYSDEVTEED